MKVPSTPFPRRYHRFGVIHDGRSTAVSLRSPAQLEEGSHGSRSTDEEHIEGSAFSPQQATKSPCTLGPVETDRTGEHRRQARAIGRCCLHRVVVHLEPCADQSPYDFMGTGIAGAEQRIGHHVVDEENPAAGHPRMTGFSFPPRPLCREVLRQLAQCDTTLRNPARGRSEHMSNGVAHKPSSGWVMHGRTFCRMREVTRPIPRYRTAIDQPVPRHIRLSPEGDRSGSYRASCCYNALAGRSDAVRRQAVRSLARSGARCGGEVAESNGSRTHRYRM